MGNCCETPLESVNATDLRLKPECKFNQKYDEAQLEKLIKV